MARPRKNLNVVTDWDQAASAAEANAAELPHLEAPRIKLQGLATQTRNLLVEQGALAARKQEVTKQLRKSLREGNLLAVFIRTGAREQFGPTSEKLTEFGLVPFRGRTKKNASAPTDAPSSETPEPSTTTTDPEVKK
jgi:hypothetical protein